VGNRYLRFDMSCVIALLLCTGVLGVGGNSLCWSKAQRAKEFTERIQLFQVGQTTEAEVRILANKYGGKYSPPSEATQVLSPQPANYHFETSSPYVTIWESPHAFPGSRLWTFST
jgi:hypothetical protein